MAPPIPVYSQKEVQSMYPTVFNGSNQNCKMYELTQQQCTFISGEVICLPFRRVFARCLVEVKKSKDGVSVADSKKTNSKTTIEKRYINIELTNQKTNDYKQFNEYFKEVNSGDDILKRFLDADKVLRQLYSINKKG